MNKEKPEEIIKSKTEQLKKYILETCIAGDLYSGPASYFPREALKYCNRNFLGERHIEMIYATLTAWGMHRFGEKGPKLPDYTCFKCHILNCKTDLEKLKDIRIETLPKDAKSSIFCELKDLVENKLRIAETSTQIVATTKALSLILPNLVPPMDRRNTAGIFDKVDINNKNFFEIVMETMYAVYQDKQILDKALKFNKKYKHVSLPKFFDNAIIQIKRNI